MGDILSGVGQILGGYVQGQYMRNQEDRKRQVEDRGYGLQVNADNRAQGLYDSQMEGVQRARSAEDAALQAGALDLPGGGVPAEDFTHGIPDAQLYDGHPDLPTTAPAGVSEKDALSLGEPQGSQLLMTGRGTIATKTGAPTKTSGMPQGYVRGSGQAAPASQRVADTPVNLGYAQRGQANSLASQDDLLQQANGSLAKARQIDQLIQQEEARDPKNLRYINAVKARFEPMRQQALADANRLRQEATAAKAMNYTQRGFSYLATGNFEAAAPYFKAIGADVEPFRGMQFDQSIGMYRLKNGAPMPYDAIEALADPSIPPHDRALLLHNAATLLQQDRWKKMQDETARIRAANVVGRQAQDLRTQALIDKAINADPDVVQYNRSVAAWAKNTEGLPENIRAKFPPPSKPDMDAIRSKYTQIYADPLRAPYTGNPLRRPGVQPPAPPAPPPAHDQGQPAEGTVIVNRTTGERKKFSGGQWVSIS
jgi:hypothetical protein